MKTKSKYLLPLAILVLQFSAIGLSLPVALPEDVNVTGTWEITVETPQGTGTPSVTLKQDGEKITGTYKGRLGESKVDGMVKGNQIKFSVSLSFQDQTLTITYSGTVEKDTMKGTAQFGDFGSGNWTAKRKPE